jgi:hypothetical protein
LTSPPGTIQGALVRTSPPGTQIVGNPLTDPPLFMNTGSPATGTQLVELLDRQRGRRGLRVDYVDGLPLPDLRRQDVFVLRGIISAQA